MTLASGTELGRYEIRSKIGEGGMGEVYLAEDMKLHRKVALKILPIDLDANKDRLRRLEQEAKAAAALNHPNLAHVYEIGESEGTNFIAMEFIDGVTPGEKGPDDALKIVAEMNEVSKLQYVSPYHFALIYTALDDREQAFASLQRAFEDQSEFMRWLRLDCRLDSLRSDSRFQDLVRRVEHPA